MRRADGPVSASDKCCWQRPLALRYMDGRDGRMRLRVRKAGMYRVSGASFEKSDALSLIHTVAEDLLSAPGSAAAGVLEHDSLVEQLFPYAIRLGVILALACRFARRDRLDDPGLGLAALQVLLRIALQ
jgi:hypothetical protein